MLGIQGNKAFKRGADWREYMRNWTEPQSMESRISGLMEKNLFPPTDAFIASLAQKYGKTYTKGKKGEDRFYSDEGRPIYPPNNGAVGKEEKTLLPKGTVISRYGPNRGVFVSPATFVLKNDVTCYKSIVAPWFAQKGGGVQLRFTNSLQELLDRGDLDEC